LTRLKAHALALVLLPAVTSACSTAAETTTAPAPSSSATSPGTSATPSAPRATAELVTGLEVPWGLDFLPNGDFLVTERAGQLIVISATEPSQRTSVDVPDVAAQGEGGLLGVAVSPSYASDRWIYAYLTTASDNRVVRLRLSDDNRALEDAELILDAIPSANYHNGGRIAFGPDGMLYVATGDAGDPDAAQDPTALNGKILRVTADGEPAPGNPTADSPVFSLGHRNVQGLAWDSAGRMFATEFGQNTLDEVNLIAGGRNYGWPVVEGEGDTRGGQFTNPLVTWTPAEASPSGLAFAQESSGGALYVAGLRGERLWRIPVAADGTTGEPEPQLVGQYGRLRTAAVSPDGSLWITTSNSDGRGDGSPDRLIQLNRGAAAQVIPEPSTS
jgi:glucose/arabinose dehydrogenase